MQIEVRTDSHIEGHMELSEEVETVVKEALGRFGDRITRVEVHLSDENAYRSGPDDKRCLIEARPERFEPIVTSHTASSLPEAVDGACGKMQRSLQTKIEKMRGR